MFRLAVRSARLVYAVSDEMADSVRREYGVIARVQMPAAESAGEVPALSTEPAEGRARRVVFAGTLTGASASGLEMLADLVNSGDLDDDGRLCELHLHTPLDAPPTGFAGGSGTRVVLHARLEPDALAAALRLASVLYLPYSFDPRHDVVTGRSFPSKLASYLAAGRPILVRAPAASTIARYARSRGFAEIVDDPSRDALLTGLRRAIGSEAYPRLAAAAARTFREAHDAVAQRSEFHAALRGLARSA
jgi:hypothetical protein